MRSSRHAVGDVLTGTPGVGKSCLAFLASHVALAHGRDVAYWDGQRQFGYLLYSDVGYKVCNHDAFVTASQSGRYLRSGALIIYDTRAPPAYFGHQTLLVTAPRFDIWSQFLRFGNVTEQAMPSIYVLPTWRDDEIRDLASHCASLPATWPQALAFTGGVPRHVFDWRFTAEGFCRPPMRTLRRLLSDVDAAFGDGLSRSARQAVDELPDKYMHFRTVGQASEAGNVPADSPDYCTDPTNPRYFKLHDVVYASQMARAVLHAAAGALAMTELAAAVRRVMHDPTHAALAADRFAAFVRRRLAQGVSPADGWRARVIADPSSAPDSAATDALGRHCFAKVFTSPADAFRGLCAHEGPFWGVAGAPFLSLTAPVGGAAADDNCDGLTLPACNFARVFSRLTGSSSSGGGSGSGSSSGSAGSEAHSRDCDSNEAEILILHGGDDASSSSSASRPGSLACIVHARTPLVITRKAIAQAVAALSQVGPAGAPPVGSCGGPLVEALPAADQGAAVGAGCRGRLAMSAASAACSEAEPLQLLFFLPQIESSKEFPDPPPLPPAVLEGLPPLRQLAVRVRLEAPDRPSRIAFNYAAVAPCSGPAAASGGAGAASASSSSVGAGSNAGCSSSAVECGIAAGRHAGAGADDSDRGKRAAAEPATALHAEDDTKRVRCGSSE